MIVCTEKTISTALSTLITLDGIAEVKQPIVGHPEPEKKNSVGIFEYILASMLKVYLDVF